MATPLKFYGRLSPYERAKLTSVFSMLFNLTTGAFGVAIGLLTSATAILVSGLHSLLLGSVKRVYFRGMPASHGDESRESAYYFAMGVLLTASSAFYTIYMLRGTANERELRFGAGAAIAVCVIAAAELIVNVRGLVTARRNGDLLLEGLRLADLSAAFVAVAAAANAITSVLGVRDIGYVIYGGRFGAIMGAAGILTGAAMSIKGALLMRKFSRRERIRIIERTRASNMPDPPANP